MPFPTSQTPLAHDSARACQAACPTSSRYGEGAVACGGKGAIAYGGYDRTTPARLSRGEAPPGRTAACVQGEDDDIVAGGEFAHAAVMPDETLRLLAPKPGGRYLDGTLGFGGHAARLMEAVGGEARLLGVDRDPDAMARARARLAPWADKVAFRLGVYADFEAFLDELGWERLDGALLDLGVSSLQLDDAERGFSFLHDGPLDMRMSRDHDEEPAAVIVNQAPHEELATLIRDLGEDPLAGRIARAIVNAREVAPIETTSQLAEIVAQAYPAKMRHTARRHPATRTFQALRMRVNRELEQLRAFLERIPARLAPGGRVVIISFHSLEDRAVKTAFRNEAHGCVCPTGAVRCVCEGEPRLRILTKKPLAPTAEEAEANSRARSAKLRAAERLTSAESSALRRPKGSPVSAGPQARGRRPGKGKPGRRR